MILRSLRLAKAVATVMYDFHCVKKLDADSYKLEMPNFHQRTADLLYNMCCENRGTYIKVGQHVGAMEYLLPSQARIHRICRFLFFQFMFPNFIQVEYIEHIPWNYHWNFETWILYSNQNFDIGNKNWILETCFLQTKIMLSIRRGCF